MGVRVSPTRVFGVVGVKGIGRFVVGAGASGVDGFVLEEGGGEAGVGGVGVDSGMTGSGFCSSAASG